MKGMRESKERVLIHAHLSFFVVGSSHLHIYKHNLVLLYIDIGIFKFKLVLTLLRYSIQFVASSS